MRELKLTARIVDQNPRHSWVQVFQNGGHAGVLAVETEHAESVVKVFANSPSLLAQRDKLLKSLKMIGNWPNPLAERDARRMKSYAQAAIAEVEQAE